LARRAVPTKLYGVSPDTSMKMSFNCSKVVLAAACSTALLTSGCASADKPSASAKPKKVPVTATAYSSGAKCNGAWAQRNAIGGRLQSGQVNSAAADWSRFQVGTKFRVVETGKVYVVDDYGSAMVGKDKVDLFHTSYRDVYRWGVRQVNLEIIEWGCPDKSLAILKPRARAPHVRRMVQALQGQQPEAG
jgi:3D (Asp-Asp-Asp) domain-containing protein